MRPTQTEQQLELWFTRQVEARGGRCLKLSLQSLRGFPDRTILMPGGWLYFVEFKTMKGRLSAQQKLWRRDLERLGFDVFVVRNQDEGLAILHGE